MQILSCGFYRPFVRIGTARMKSYGLPTRHGSHSSGSFGLKYSQPTAPATTASRYSHQGEPACSVLLLACASGPMAAVPWRWPALRLSVVVLVAVRSWPTWVVKVTGPLKWTLSAALAVAVVGRVSLKD